MNQIKSINKLSKHSDKKSELHGEVFTPFPLINEMFDSLPKSTWSDSSKTFLDPAAGNGNMPAVLVERLMNGLSKEIPDERQRYRHIIEKQIYMAEYQRESALNIEKIFNPDGDLKLNLYVGDSLLMPDDFWDVDYETRLRRYPQHHVSCTIPDAEKRHGKPHVNPVF